MLNAISNLQWCDIGVNLFSSQFDADRSQVISRAKENGVSQLVLIGSDITESQQNLQLCQQHSGCFTTAGVHPHQAAHVLPDWLTALDTLLQRPEIVALGECGLDYNRDFSPREQQQYVFAEQLKLASAHNKPLYLHERDAFDTQLAMLTEHNISHGVAHCFTGDTAQLRAYLDLGLYIGITGWICDTRRNTTLIQALRYVPDDRLLLETDSPYLTPRNLTPKPAKGRNEPAFLPSIATVVAELRNIPVQQLSDITFSNSQRLFGLPGAERTETVPQ